jgi:hypothetical protein
MLPAEGLPVAGKNAESPQRVSLLGKFTTYRAKSYATFIQYIRFLPFSQAEKHDFISFVIFVRSYRDEDIHRQPEARFPMISAVRMFRFIVFQH